MSASCDAVLECYRALLAELWEQASRVVGESAVHALLESALSNARSDYSLLESVQLSNLGPDLSGLADRSEDPRRLHQALERWVHEFFTAVRLLTGELLVRQLDPAWDRARQRLEGVISHE